MTILNKSYVDPSDITGVFNSLITATEGVVTGIVADTAGIQASATQLSAYINHINTTSVLYSGVKLPSATKGTDIVIVNSGAYPIRVFPSTGENINDNSANAAVLVANKVVAYFISPQDGQWHTNAPSVSPFYSGVTNNIAASSSGTQVGGTALYSHINRVITTGGNNYSVRLPVAENSSVGGNLFVINAATHAFNVFPPVGGTIDQYSVNTSVSVALNATTQFVAISELTWYTVH